MFEPLVPGTFQVPNTNIYRAPIFGDDPKAFGRWAADQIEQQILFEGPDTVAAVFLEPVQNAGGCFRRRPATSSGCARSATSTTCCWSTTRSSAPSADWARCSAARSSATSRHDHLRQGHDLGLLPDRRDDRLRPHGRPFYQGDNTFLHGYTFGGHPVSAAVGLANLDIFEREGLNQHVLDNEGAFRATLEKLLDLPIVGDVRGNGFFYGIELVKDKATKETFDADESERVLCGFLSKALFDTGLYCRADDRGDPVIQLAPPLICGQAEFDEMEQILRGVPDRGLVAPLTPCSADGRLLRGRCRRPGAFSGERAPPARCLFRGKGTSHCGRVEAGRTPEGARWGGYSPALGS